MVIKEPVIDGPAIVRDGTTTQLAPETVAALPELSKTVAINVTRAERVIDDVGAKADVTRKDRVHLTPEGKTEKYVALAKDGSRRIEKVYKQSILDVTAGLKKNSAQINAPLTMQSLPFGKEALDELGIHRVRMTMDRLDALSRDGAVESRAAIQTLVGLAQDGDHEIMLALESLPAHTRERIDVHLTGMKLDATRRAYRTNRNPELATRREALREVSLRLTANAGAAYTNLETRITGGPYPNARAPLDQLLSIAIEATNTDE